MKTRRRLIAEFAAISDVYKRSMSPEMIRIYLELLSGYSDEAVIKAIHRHLEDPKAGQFFPKPADLLRWLTPDLDARALEAWGRVKDAAFIVGAYESVDFEDLVLHQVVTDMGGWPNWFGWSEAEDPFKQQEFCRRYVMLSRRDDIVGPRTLVGLYELNNRGEFPKWVPPTKVLGVRGEIKALVGGGARYGTIRGELGGGAIGDGADTETSRAPGPGQNSLSVDRPEDEEHGPGATGEGQESR